MTVFHNLISLWKFEGTPVKNKADVTVAVSKSITTQKWKKFEGTHGRP